MNKAFSTGYDNSKHQTLNSKRLEHFAAAPVGLALDGEFYFAGVNKIAHPIAAKLRVYC